MITRHGQFLTAINVINIYGSQEGRVAREKIEESWGNVLKEVGKIESKGELVVIIGDLNRHLGDIIEGNEKDKLSYGGSMIKDFIETGKYVLVNASKKVIGGPFTRYEPSDPENDDKKSVLSLCIVSAELFEYVDSLTIDKEKHITPYRTISKSKKTFTDHYTMIVLFKNIPLKPVKNIGCRKVTRWNTNKEGGWETYKEMAAGNNKLIEIANANSEDSNDIMKKIDNELDKIRYQAFGKVKEKSKKTTIKEIDVLQKEKEALLKTKCDVDLEEKVKLIDEKIATTLLQKQREQFEKELKTITDVKARKGKSAAIFVTKERIVGPKSAAQEATVLTDPKSGAEVSTPSDIKCVSLDYCKALLTNRKPKEEFKEDLFMKDLIHNIRMTESIEDDIQELTVKIFNSTYEKLLKKPGSKYDFIMKGGQALKAALFKLYQVVWTTETLPDRWEKSTLVQLYKGQGLRSVLDNMRHIHIKDEFPKYFGHLVVSEAKDKMTKGMTKYQIGTKPGHRAQEHLFVLKSVIALYFHLDQVLTLSLWDVSIFFDWESLVDCTIELYSVQVLH